MKHSCRLFISTVAIVVLTSFNIIQPVKDTVTGAWQGRIGDRDEVMTFVDGYFVHTSYDQQQKKFYNTWGGPYQINAGAITVQVEFNAAQEQQVGEKVSLPFTVATQQLSISVNNQSLTLKQVDDGMDKLAGTWQITGRLRNGEIAPMNPGPRKTLKILSGTRFQWVAMNTATKEFSGTGGGNYTFTNGTYTENIEFFSRDSSRVGASLQFEGSVSNKEWTHKGLSSRGEPVHEIWKRIVP